MPLDDETRRQLLEDARHTAVKADLAYRLIHPTLD
jgi:hypothetical protein